MKRIAEIIINFNKIFLLILFLMAIFIRTGNLYASDFDIWTIIGANKKMEKMDFSIRNVNYFKIDAGWYINFTEVEYNYKTLKEIKFGVAYRHEFIKVFDGFKKEYRPVLHLYYSKQFGEFQLVDRNRMEFRIFQTGSYTRYRNQFQLNYNTFEKFSPFLSTEFFINFNKIRYVRQRTTLGVKVPYKSIYVNLFGVHEIDNTNPEIWSNKIVLGASLNYRF